MHHLDILIVKLRVQCGRSRKLHFRIKFCNWSWEARLSELDLGSQLATLDQARRAAIASETLDEGLTGTHGNQGALCLLKLFFSLSP